MPLKMLQPEGLITALVFMTAAVLIESEIPENLVIVDVRPVFLGGYDGVLKCQFNGEPLAVFWLKGTDLATGTNLVTWYPPPRGISGSGYESGKYNLTEEFSLVIHDVDEDDAGRYICRISNFRGFILRNFTNATVQVPPQRPFPTIDTCSSETSASATEPCIVTLETGAGSTDLTCRTMGATKGLVSLYWAHGGAALPHQAPQRSPNADGVTEDVIATINATSSDDPYVCVAILSTTTNIKAKASVTVKSPPVVTTSEAFRTTNATVFPPISGDNDTTVVIVVSLCVCIPIIIVILSVLIWKKRRRLNPEKGNDEGLVSYLELWELVEMCDIVVADSIVSKLVGNPERESDYDFVRSKADLYRELCGWKEGKSRYVNTLYKIIEKEGLYIELKQMRDFRSRTDQISDDNLEHICWHVFGCRETVKPILRALYSQGVKMTKLTDDPQTPGNPRCAVISDDLQLMKGWKTKLMTTHPDKGVKKDVTVEYRTGPEEVNIKDKALTTIQPMPNETTDVKKPANQDEDDSSERTPIYPAGSEEVDLKAKTLPPNQVIQVCLALEEAGRKAVKCDQLVYQQLAKTFFAIREKYKSELADEILKQFALSITKRHYQRLGESLRLHEKDIAVRNGEDLSVMFRTDIMLKTWVLEQRCSNYEIRRRLRRAAEQCHRQDIADLFISKDQNEVVPSNATLPACLTFTNEKQRAKSSTPKSSKLGSDTPSQAEQQDDHRDIEETQPRDNVAESEFGYVTAISRDELDRIGRYAGQEALYDFCKKYGVGEVPEQQSELPFKTMINTLKPKLDVEHAKTNRTGKGDTPRYILRQLLEDKYSPYACLLPRGKEKEDSIFNVELIELAFRLVMADVYPFAEALGISDQLLISYKPNFGPKSLRQGTVRILNNEDRFEMVKALKQAAYPEEAKAIYFGFEIGLGDVVEVENRVDMKKLAQQLCVPDDIRGTSPDNQSNGDERQKSVLLRWKETVRSSTFNQRLVLADALFNMDEKTLALHIISGVYRKRVMNDPVIELVANTIPEGRLPDLSKVLGLKVKKGQNCQDVITDWAGENAKKFFGLIGKNPRELSNLLLDAGFYHFARELMAGAWRGKEDKKAAHEEAKETGDVASEEMPHEGRTSNEQGAEQGQKDKERTEKDTKDDTLRTNTGKEGAGEGKKDKTDSEAVEDKKGMEKVSRDDTLRKNTEKGGGSQDRDFNKFTGKETSYTEVTEEDNSGTQEEGQRQEKSNERGKVEGSETPLPETAKVDHWGQEGILDTSQNINATMMSRWQVFI